jgi:hypothetical protein
MFPAKQALWAILFGSPFSPYSSAQNVVETHRNCGSMEYLAHQIATNPEMKAQRDRIEAQTFDFVRRDPSVSARAVITIPVVVHVLYNSTRDNVSDAQIMSQIDALNRDFRKMNAESANIPAAFQAVAADANIEFCLARRQPNGLPTTGIERLASINTAWQANDDMKRAQNGGLSAWDATKYLNIWVCALSGGALGYGTFPGSPLITDGVVIDYRYFGTYNTRAPFNLGRTATHEVGHWLNLYHIWGDANCGDDHCDDTPTHHGANYGCPTYPYTQTNCHGSNVEMTMNFMDYTNDACMYMFSNGQKARMLSLFAVGGVRRGIVESNVCGTIITPPLVCAAPTNFYYSNVSEQSVTLNWTASADNATFTIEYRRTSDTAWTSAVNSASNSFVISNLQPVTFYQVRLRARCSNTIESANSSILTFQTLQKIIIPPPPPIVDCVDAYEPNNTLSTAQLLGNTIKTTGIISDVRDRDWFSIKTTIGTTVKISITGLPADYDMRLFDNRLRLVQSSENQGTSDEKLKYTTTAGQEFLLLYIYGYNGAFNADKCYSLQISSSINGVTLNNATNNSNPIDMPNFNSTIDSNLINFREKRGEKRVYTEGSLMSPNPTNGVLNIELPTNNAAKIQVFNPRGQLFLEHKKPFLDDFNRCAIDLSSAHSGIYLVKIEQDGKVWTKKIFKTL